MSTRRDFLRGCSAGVAGGAAISGAARVPDKLVVLTFDDVVKSHRTVVAPMLKELGFGATFFVTHRWMPDRENFMSWEDVAEIHRMGFEIGNHTWTHDNFATPRNAARLEGELALVEQALAKVGVPRPVSFAYPGNSIGPEAAKIVGAHGLKFGRRGLVPEVRYEMGLNQVGAAFDPGRHHPLVIPSTGIADPCWTMEHFRRVIAGAREGHVAVLQFHGVPDPTHPWVYTSPEEFRAYMGVLKQEGFKAIALRDLEPYLDRANGPVDPVLSVRHPSPRFGRLSLPVEAEATQADLDFWLQNMLVDHRYSLAEAARVCGLPEAEVKTKAAALGRRASRKAGEALVLPYPGGRHPRIGFLEGAFDPQRGTKASVFLPWDPESYVVVDLPEAIFSNLGLIFLAHTHVPTLWNEQNAVLENVDWNREAGYALNFKRQLPNGIIFGASIQPRGDRVEMEMWLRNVTHLNLTGLRTQVCVMLKGAPDFNAQTNDNKLLRKPAAAVRSAKEDHWIVTAWERCGRVWANPPVPCIHSDPVFPDCPSGQTVRLRGRLWFSEGAPDL